LKPGLQRSRLRLNAPSVKCGHGFQQIEQSWESISSSNLPASQDSSRRPVQPSKVVTLRKRTLKPPQRYPDKGEVGGSSPPRLTRYLFAHSHFCRLRDCRSKSRLPTICQLSGRAKINVIATFLALQRAGKMDFEETGLILSLRLEFTSPIHCWRSRILARIFLFFKSRSARTTIQNRT
jgi:hypothetical protein